LRLLRSQGIPDHSAGGPGRRRRLGLTAPKVMRAGRQ
jgi:hypothetical protein